VTFLALVPKWVWALLAALAVVTGAYFYGHARGAGAAAIDLGRYQEAARTYERDMKACQDLSSVRLDALNSCNKDKTDAAVAAEIQQRARDAAAEKERRRIVAEIVALMAKNDATPLPSDCQDAVREWARREAEIRGER
jgi:hypothetical protein